MSKQYLPWYPYQLYNLFYYLPYINQWKLTFYNRSAEHRFRHFQVDRSWPYMVLPTIALSLFALRGTVFLLKPNYFDTSVKRLYIFTELLQEENRTEMETTLLIATILKVAYVAFVLRKSLLDYRFLAIFTVNVKGSNGIKPKHLNLTHFEVKSFERLRGVYLPIANFVNAWVLVIATIAEFFEIVRKSLWYVHFGWTIFWFLFWIFWVASVGDCLFGTPTFLAILFSYIRFKQQGILHQLTKLTCRSKQSIVPHRHRFALRVTQLNRRYNWIIREVKDYNRFTYRFLTLFVIMVTVNITYISYVLLLTKTSDDFRVMYSIVWMSYVFMLFVIILYAASVHKKHKLIAQAMYQVLACAHQSPQFSPCQLLKLQIFSQILSRANVGFNLVNSYVIDYNTYTVVIYLITVFLFLIFKKGSLLPIY